MEECSAAAESGLRAGCGVRLRFGVGGGEEGKSVFAWGIDHVTVVTILLCGNLLYGIVNGV